MKEEEENKKKRMKQMKKDELIALRHDADELYDEEQLMDENFTVKKDTGFSVFLVLRLEFILEVHLYSLQCLII